MRSLTSLSSSSAARLIVLALASVALTACSSADAEQGTADGAGKAEAAWLADVEEVLGAEATNVEALRQQAAASCAVTAAEDWTVELALSGATSTSDVTRVGIEHLCPEVLPAFDEARAAVDAADDTNALVCTLPADALSSDSQLKLKLVCAR